MENHDFNRESNYEGTIFYSYVSLTEGTGSLMKGLRKNHVCIHHYNYIRNTVSYELSND